MNTYAVRAEKTSSEKDKTGIPRRMKTGFEHSSGFSFDNVRVHYNSEKPAQLHAHAYTQGNEVYVAPGQEKHLPHELGHVVQQKSDMVKPTGEIGGLPLNDDEAMENGADLIAENAENAEDFGGAPVQAKFKGDGVVQRANLHSEESYNLHAGFLSTLIGGVSAVVGIGSSIYSSRLERKRLYEGEVEKYAEAACEAQEEQVAAIWQRRSPNLDLAEKTKAEAEDEKLRAKIRRNYDTAIKKAIKMGAFETEDDNRNIISRTWNRIFHSKERQERDNTNLSPETLEKNRIKEIKELNVRNALLRAQEAFVKSRSVAPPIPPPPARAQAQVPAPPPQQQPNNEEGNADEAN